MPTYEYRCRACGRQQDIVQKMSDPTLVECPLCGAPQLERLISASAFALRGGGWYADGYGAKPGAGESGGTSSPAKAEPAASGDAAKPEAKEAPKTESAPKAEPAAPAAPSKPSSD